MSRRGPLRTVAITVAIALGAGTVAGAQPASLPGGPAAPRRLVLTIGQERLSLGSGVAEADLNGADPVLVKSASGLTSSVQFSTVLRDVWLVDVGSSVSRGSRVNAAGGSSSAPPGSDLSGLGDVRVRVSRRLDRFGVRVTAAANIPTGVTSLDAGQTATLSVLGSPALGMTPPSVGFGAGGTLGVVKSLAAASRQWGVAMGASVEWRGSYEPFAALGAGVPLTGYDPGEVVRLSAGATRLFGASKGLLTASLDLYGTDQVKAAGLAAPIGVRIGRTLSLDAQWLPATTRLRGAALFAGVRVRSALERDGVPIAGSGNVFFEGGGRGATALTRDVDAVFELTARVNTAVNIDNRMATAAGTSVAPAVGVSVSRSSWTLQPMLTARVGTVDTGAGRGGFRTLGLRLAVDRRF